MGHILTIIGPDQPASYTLPTPDLNYLRLHFSVFELPREKVLHVIGKCISKITILH